MERGIGGRVVDDCFLGWGSCLVCRVGCWFWVGRRGRCCLVVDK